MSRPRIRSGIYGVYDRSAKQSIAKDFRKKPKGWKYQPTRHALAAKGIKTGHAIQRKPKVEHIMGYGDVDWSSEEQEEEEEQIEERPKKTADDSVYVPKEYSELEQLEKTRAEDERKLEEEGLQKDVRARIAIEKDRIREDRRKMKELEGELHPTAWSKLSAGLSDFVRWSREPKNKSREDYERETAKLKRIRAKINDAHSEI